VKVAEVPTKKLLTSTVLSNGTVVPWLAASGELSYSPENPPELDYYFQYSWVLPGILNPEENKRKHFWFGHPGKDDSDVKLLLNFWNSARRGEVNKVFQDHGRITPNEVTAPIGIYRHKSIYSFQEDQFLFIQHGSYLIINVSSQPCLEDGEVILYRGIQNTDEFNLYRVNSPEVRSKLMRVHAETLTDSVTSFNSVHCNVCRSETGFLNDRHTLLLDLAEKSGLKRDQEETVSLLYSGYALEEWCAKNKFGPNYVKFKTPATNIRITTFIANETEVKVIDPNKLEVIEAVGCRVKEIEI
jgi:hypothetical protein